MAKRPVKKAKKTTTNKKPVLSKKGKKSKTLIKQSNPVKKKAQASKNIKKTVKKAIPKKPKLSTIKKVLKQKISEKKREKVIASKSKSKPIKEAKEKEIKVVSKPTMKITSSKPSLKLTVTKSIIKTVSSSSQTKPGNNKSLLPSRPKIPEVPIIIPPEEHDENYMNDIQKKHFKHILLNWKQQLLEEMERTVHHMQDDAAVLSDPNDRATQEEEFSLELRARDRELKLIKKIEEALERLDNDDYGFCEACGVEIGAKRLEARPTATLCIDCKTIDEIREKHFS